MWHDVRCKQKHAVLCEKKITDSKPNDTPFGEVLKALYRKYHSTPKPDIQFYSPFVLPVTAFASMFSVMSVVFFSLLKFLASTKTEDEDTKTAKGSKNGVVNKGFA